VKPKGVTLTLISGEPISVTIYGHPYEYIIAHFCPNEQGKSRAENTENYVFPRKKGGKPVSKYV